MIAQLSAKIRSLASNPQELRKAATAFGGTVLLSSVVVTGVLVAARQLGALEAIELRAYDHLMRSRPDEGLDNRLLIVAISEEDIQSRNEFPISDRTLAQLLEKLAAYQPRAVGLDILRDVPIGTGRAELVQQLQSENIISACKLSAADEPGNPAAPGVPEDRIGFADLPQDRDVSIRRNILISTPTAFQSPGEQRHLCNYDDSENQVPSLSLLLSILYLEEEGVELDQTETGDLVLGSATFKRLGESAGGYQDESAEDYRVLLNYRSSQNVAEQVSLSEVLAGKVDSAKVRDRIVLIGYTAQSANDDFPTPYSAGQQDSRKMPGVMIHAHSVSQILSAALEGRRLIWYLPLWGEVLWIFSWSVVGGTLAWSIRRPWVFGVAGGVAIALLYSSNYVLFLNAGWIPLIPPVLGLLTTAGSVILIDRFNKTAYAQAFYKGVKGFLKIDIDIDHEQKEQQVAEITESEYFQELQQKAKEIRTQRNSSHTAEADSTDNQTETTSEPTTNDDYFQQLQQKGNQIKRRPRHPRPEAAAEPGNEPEEIAPITEPETTTSDDYFQRLQQKAKRLKRKDDLPKE